MDTHIYFAVLHRLIAILTKPSEVSLTDKGNILETSFQGNLKYYHSNWVSQQILTAALTYIIFPIHSFIHLIQHSHSLNKYLLHTY